MKKLPKFQELRRLMGWSVNETLGTLGNWWSETLEVQEDGDVTQWHLQDFGELVNVKDPAKLWDALRKTGWIDTVGRRLLVHDWVDYAGPYLRKKYGGAGDHDRLARIWALYGREYGKKAGPEIETGSGLNKVSNESLPNLTKPNQRTERKAQSRAFQPPSIEEVRAYCLERRNGVEPQRFLDFYASKGWVVGKAPMRDWKAAIRTWEGRGEHGTARRAVGGAAPQPEKYARL
jgi:hypothetical protein